MQVKNSPITNQQIILKKQHFKFVQLSVADRKMLEKDELQRN